MGEDLEARYIRFEDSLPFSRINIEQFEEKVMRANHSATIT
jgi:hypothetical protein